MEQKAVLRNRLLDMDVSELRQKYMCVVGKFSAACKELKRVTEECNLSKINTVSRQCYDDLQNELRMSETRYNEYVCTSQADYQQLSDDKDLIISLKNDTINELKLELELYKLECDGKGEDDSPELNSKNGTSNTIINNSLPDEDSCSNQIENDLKILNDDTVCSVCKSKINKSRDSGIDEGDLGVQDNKQVSLDIEQIIGTLSANTVDPEDIGDVSDTDSDIIKEYMDEMVLPSPLSPMLIDIISCQDSYTQTVCKVYKTTSTQSYIELQNIGVQSTATMKNNTTQVDRPNFVNVHIQTNVLPQVKEIETQTRSEVISNGTQTDDLFSNTYNEDLTNFNNCTKLFEKSCQTEKSETITKCVLISTESQTNNRGTSVSVDARLCDCSSNIPSRNPNSKTRNNREYTQTLLHPYSDNLSSNSECSFFGKIPNVKNVIGSESYSGILTPPLSCDDSSTRSKLPKYNSELLLRRDNRNLSKRLKSINKSNKTMMLRFNDMLQKQSIIMESVCNSFKDCTKSLAKINGKHSNIYGGDCLQSKNNSCSSSSYMDSLNKVTRWMDSFNEEPMKQKVIEVKVRDVGCQFDKRLTKLKTMQENTFSSKVRLKSMFGSDSDLCDKSIATSFQTKRKCRNESKTFKSKRRKIKIEDTKIECLSDKYSIVYSDQETRLKPESFSESDCESIKNSISNKKKNVKLPIKKINRLSFNSTTDCSEATSPRCSQRLKLKPHVNYSYSKPCRRDSRLSSNASFHSTVIEIETKCPSNEQLGDVSNKTQIPSSLEENWQNKLTKSRKRRVISTKVGNKTFKLKNGKSKVTSVTETDLEEKVTVLKPTSKIDPPLATNLKHEGSSSNFNEDASLKTFNVINKHDVHSDFYANRKITIVPLKSSNVSIGSHVNTEIKESILPHPTLNSKSKIENVPESRCVILKKLPNSPMSNRTLMQVELQESADDNFENQTVINRVRKRSLTFMSEPLPIIPHSESEEEPENVRTIVLNNVHLDKCYSIVKPFAAFQSNTENKVNAKKRIAHLPKLHTHINQKVIPSVLETCISTEDAAIFENASNVDLSAPLSPVQEDTTPSFEPIIIPLEASSKLCTADLTLPITDKKSIKFVEKVEEACVPLKNGALPSSASPIKDDNVNTLGSKEELEETPKVTKALAAKILETLVRYESSFDVELEIARKFVKVHSQVIASVTIGCIIKCLHSKCVKIKSGKLNISVAQKKLLGFLLLLAELKGDANFMAVVLTRLEDHILHNTPIELLVCLTQFYVAYCRLYANIFRVRFFVIRALYKMDDHILPVLYTIITNWPDIFGQYKKDSTDGVLVRGLVQIIRFIGTKDQELSKYQVVKLLNQCLMYEMEMERSEDLIVALLFQYFHKPDICKKYVIIMLCRKLSIKKMCEIIEGAIFKKQSELGLSEVINVIECLEFILAEFEIHPGQTDKLVEICTAFKMLKDKAIT